MQRIKTRKLKAFSFIELILVVAIIGILSTVIFLEIRDAQARSRYARIVDDMSLIAKMTLAYSADNAGKYPADANVNRMPTGLEKYINGGWPQSPCGSNYQYDYQSWVYVAPAGGNPARCDTGGSGKIEEAHLITLNKVGSSDPYLFYYDMANSSKCATMFPMMNNIQTYPTKKITCNE